MQRRKYAPTKGLFAWEPVRADDCEFFCADDLADRGGVPTFGDNPTDSDGGSPFACDVIGRGVILLVLKTMAIFFTLTITNFLARIPANLLAATSTISSMLEMLATTAAVSLAAAAILLEWKIMTVFFTWTTTNCSPRISADFLLLTSVLTSMPGTSATASLGFPTLRRTLLQRS